jgi:glutamate-5-semialdehyde dehydrogenase
MNQSTETEPVVAGSQGATVADDQGAVGAFCLDLGQRAKAAAMVLRSAPTEAKNRALLRLSQLILQSTESLLLASAADVHKAAGLPEVMLDRLRLTTARLADLAAAVRQVAALPDPVGEVAQLRRQPNGLLVGRMRIALGVVLMVYEARPGVTIDAAALCIKSGNACVLRGGSEAHHTNLALAALVTQALVEALLPADCVQVVKNTDRQVILELLKLESYIDLAIPRGGPGLIRFVAEHARVPVIKHYQGICHLFVDSSADLEVALRIVDNSKASRPGVCNALETLLCHRDLAGRLLPELAARLPQVELRGDDTTCRLVPRARPAMPLDWDTEFLALILAVRVVDDLQGALLHGSQHTASIVTNDYANSQRFLREVDASCVLVNASTRFNDGGELGLGTEIGISTTKLHAFGPMGLYELTTQKFIVYGEGQVRP